MAKTENLLLLGGSTKQVCDERTLCEIMKNLRDVEARMESPQYLDFKHRLSRVNKIEEQSIRKLYLFSLIFRHTHQPSKVLEAIDIKQLPACFEALLVTLLTTKGEARSSELEIIAWVETLTEAFFAAEIMGKTSREDATYVLSLIVQLEHLV